MADSSASCLANAGGQDAKESRRLVWLKGWVSFSTHQNLIKILTSCLPSCHASSSAKKKEQKKLFQMNSSKVIEFKPAPLKKKKKKAPQGAVHARTQHSASEQSYAKSLSAQWKWLMSKVSRFDDGETIVLTSYREASLLRWRTSSAGLHPSPLLTLTATCHGRLEL